MEKKTVSFPVTQENFAETWDWLDTCRRQTVLKKYVTKIAGSVGNILFFLLMCILIYGFYRQQGSQAFREFLRLVPVLPQLWDWLLLHVLRPELGTWGQIGVLVGMLYLIPVAAQGLCSGIVRLCCRPAERGAPEGDARETAGVLLMETEKLVIAHKREHMPSNIVWNLVFLALAAGVIGVFVLYAGIQGDEDAVFYLMAQINSIGFMLFVVALWGGYSALNYPLIWTTRLLCRSKLPEDLLQQIQAYSFQCDPEKKARLEEEDRILALAEEIKARRKQEREALYK